MNENNKAASMLEQIPNNYSPLIVKHNIIGKNKKSPFATPVYSSKFSPRIGVNKHHFKT